MSNNSKNNLLVRLILLIFVISFSLSNLLVENWDISTLLIIIPLIILTMDFIGLFSISVNITVFSYILCLTAINVQSYEWEESLIIIILPVMAISFDWFDMFRNFIEIFKTDMDDEYNDDYYLEDDDLDDEVERIITKDKLKIYDKKQKNYKK